MNLTNFCRNSKQESMTKDTNTANMAQKYGLKINSYKGPSWSFGSYGRNNYDDEDATPSGFPWPPRSYTCSFCKREFRSAQALGGHMNVHRRDRARLLRQYSPPSETCGDCSNDNCKSTNGNVSSLNSNNVEPNPNPSLSSNPISYHTKSPTFASSLPVICPAVSGQFKKLGGYNEGFKLITNDLIATKAASKGHVEGEKFNASVQEKVCEEGDVVRLDLEIGLIGHHQYKGELDLELRLGYI